MTAPAILLNSIDLSRGSQKPARAKERVRAKPFSVSAESYMVRASQRHLRSRVPKQRLRAA